VTIFELKHKKKQQNERSI